MKRMLRVVAATVGVALPLAVVAAQGKGPAAGGDVTEAALTFRPFQSAAEMLERSGSGLGMMMQPVAKGAEAYRLPPAVGKPLLFRTYLFGMRGQVAGVLAKSKPSVKTGDRLWLDWNGDRKFTPDEALQGRLSGKYTVFGPLRGRRGAKEKRPAFCILLDPRMGSRFAYVTPPGLYEGELQLKGRNVKLALMDTDGDGEYGPGGFGDALWVDLDGDGRLSGAARISPLPSWDTEALPLARRMQMPDGGYYRVTVAKDGSRLTVQPDTTPLGSVKVGGGRFLMVLTGQEGLWQVRSSGGEALVPVGSHHVQWVQLSLPDKTGGTWSVLQQVRVQRPIEVAAGTTTELVCGPPFRLEVKVSPKASGKTFSLDLRDRAGNSVIDVQTPSGGRPPAPELRITDANGKVVKAEKFHYG